MRKVGSHKNLKILERICQLCKKNVEEVIHFFLNYELYDEIRKPINSVRKKIYTPIIYR